MNPFEQEGKSMSNPSYKGITLAGQAVEVAVSGARIDAVREIPATPGLPRLLPPLVDLQQNGALGVAFNNIAREAPGQLRRVAELLIRNGVGRVLATLTTAPYEVLENAADSLRRELDADPDLNALFFGIFHEGVFISPDCGWRGGHDPAYILPPDWERFRRLNERSGNRVKLVNLAPEVPGAMTFIDKATAAGVKVTLGHCHPDTAVLREAVERGASMVTHFGNGAAPEIHRFKNPFWGFLSQEKLALGLVGDGFHLPPEVVRTALLTKGPEKCFMVSDANIYSGCKPGLYHRLGGLDCVIEPNGFIHVAGQEILAGAWFQNNRSVEFLVNQVGLDFETAWRLCSEIPARLMDISLPDLTPGSEATFVQAHFENQKLMIEQSVFRGQNYITTEAPNELQEIHTH